jgi:hypothetical protein
MSSYDLYAHVSVHDSSTLDAPDYPGSPKPGAPHRLYEPSFCRHVLVGNYKDQAAAIDAMDKLEHVEVAPNEFVPRASIVHFHIVERT